MVQLVKSSSSALSAPTNVAASLCSWTLKRGTLTCMGGREPFQPWSKCSLEIWELTIFWWPGEHRSAHPRCAPAGPGRERQTRVRFPGQSRTSSTSSSMSIRTMLTLNSPLRHSISMMCTLFLCDLYSAGNLFKIIFRASAELVQVLPINLRYIYKRVFH